MAEPTGTSFKDLIRYATSKESASRKDFESAMSARGYKPSQVRRLGNAFDRVNSSGNEYQLHSEKGFNVFSPEGSQKTGSGKTKGNKAGLDLGDVVGLGNDVSLLAGALRNEMKGFGKAKEAENKAVTPEEPRPVQVSPKLTGQIATSITRPAKTRTGQSGQNTVAKATNKTTDPDDTNQGFFNPGQNNEQPKQNEQKKQPSTEVATNPKAPTGDNNDEDFRLDKLLIGDFTNLYDPKWYKDFATTFNPAQIWSKEARDKAVALGQEMSGKDKQDWMAQNPGENYDNRAVSTGIGNNAGMLNMLMSPGKTGAQGVQGLFKNPVFGQSASELAETSRAVSHSRLVKEMRDIISSNIPDAAKAMRLKTVSEQLAKYRTATPAAKPVKEMLRLGQGARQMPAEEGLGSYLEGVHSPEIPSFEPGYGAPGSPEYFPTGGYDKGGKLPKARWGMNFDETPTDPFALDFTTRGYENARQYGDIMRPEGTSVSGDVPDWWNGGTPATQSEITLTPGNQGTQKEIGINPKGQPKQGLPYDDILAGALRYGAPAAYLGAEQAQINRLRGKMNPHLTAPDFMVGAERSLPRPNFALPYHPGLEGSSLSEAQSAGLARSKAERDARLEFELKDALSKQSQRDQILNRTNQNIAQKAGIKNQEELIRANNAANEFGYLLNDRGTTAGSLFYNLDKGISDYQLTGDVKNRQQAEFIIRNPSRFPNQADQDWARAYLSGRTSRKNMSMSKAKGGKFSKVMC